MEINTERINRVVIPRRSLAKRVILLWLFEVLICLCGVGILWLVSIFCALEMIFLTAKFCQIWKLYYHPASLYVLLVLLIIPAIPAGLGLRRLIWWLIFDMPMLFF